MDYVGHGLNFDLSGDVNEESYSPTQMKNFFRTRRYVVVAESLEPWYVFVKMKKKLAKKQSHKSWYLISAGQLCHRRFPDQQWGHLFNFIPFMDYEVKDYIRF